MLQSLYISDREIYPSVSLDKEKGIFNISGRSLPEDVDTYFIPILEWLQNYQEQPNEYTEFHFKFDYYNSSTVRKIVDILVILETISEQEGKSTKVVWHYEEGDDVMCENGEDFKNVISIPFELIPYKIDREQD